MNISPLDIRKQTFRTVFRGADNEEVRVFLDLVASEQERLIELNGQLTERIRHCEDRLAEYKEIDQTLRNTVLTAERHVAEARETAQREANLIVQEGEWRAKQMLEDARERLNRLSDEVRDLQAKKDAYIQHLRSFLDAQLELLDRNETYLEGVNRLTDEVAAAVARTRRMDVRPVAPPSTQRPGPRPPMQQGDRETGMSEAGYPPQMEEISPAPPGERQAPVGFPPRTGLPSQSSQSAQAGYAPSSQQNTFPPARGLSRFNRPPYAPPSREPGRPRDGSTEEASPNRPGSERSEGLFEISAEEEEPPRP